MSFANKPQVTVTGGNGFIATALIDELIKRGYRIHATVRNIAKETQFRERFPSVRLFEADLLTPGSFDAAFAGSEIIFHMASPVILQSNDPENEIIKPAVQGTENAIRAALTTPSVRRIVLTSSIAASSATGDSSVMTEESWNNDAPGVGGAYSRSKALAERKAWELIKEYEASGAFKTRPVSLVAVLPSLVVGVPIFPSAIRSSLGMIFGLVDGSSKARGGVASFNFKMVDIRDVVRVHVDAAENTQLTGRLLTTTRKPYSMLDVAHFLAKQFPQLADQIPTELTPGAPPTSAPRVVDNSRTEKQLGWAFADPEQALTAFVESLLANGIVKLTA